MNIKQDIYKYLIIPLSILLILTSSSLSPQLEQSSYEDYLSNIIQISLKNPDTLSLRKFELILQTTPSLSDSLKAKGYNKLGVAYNRLKNWDKALQSLNKSIHFGKDEIIASSEFSKFITYRNQGEFAFADKQLKKALDKYNQLKTSYESSYALYLAGKFYAQNYYPDKGISYYFKAYNCFNEINNGTRKLMVGKEISRLYFEMKNYKQSQNILQDCLEEAISLNDTSAILFIYNRKASLFNYDSKPDSAIVWLNKWKQTNHKENESKYWYNLG